MLSFRIFDCHISMCSFDHTKFHDSDYHSLNISNPFTHNIKPSNKRLAEYLAGRLCAKQALKSIGIVDFEVASGNFNEPIWPSNVIGSITHSNTIAASFVGFKSNFRGLGIDIEEIIDVSVAKDVCKFVIDAKELAVIQNAASSFEEGFTLTFSAKESFFKAAFNTIYDYLDFSAIKLRRLCIKERVLEFEIPCAALKSKLKINNVNINFHYLPNNHLMTLLAL